MDVLYDITEDGVYVLVEMGFSLITIVMNVVVLATIKNTTR